MSRETTPSRTPRRRRGSAGLIAAIAVAAIVVAAVAGVFAFALLRPEPAPVAASPTATVSAPTPTASPTPTATPEAPSTPAPTVPAPPVSPATQICEGAPTTLSIWAHPDDDIIFANPTISSAIAAGECVRTVFVTAGDAGKGGRYVSGRELGILRAYNAMRGADALWDTTDLTLDSGLHARRLTPQGDPRVSVLFLHLPDGNITGAGFDATGHATLSKLYDGVIPSISPFDGGAGVSRDQLVASLRELAGAFAPTHLLTHIPRGSTFAPGDHPDHSVVGALVRDTLGSDPAVGPGIQYFVGYPSADLPRNVDGATLDTKVDTYRIYTQQDEVIRCADRDACLGTRKFGEWLRRSYPKAEADLQMG